MLQPFYTDRSGNSELTFKEPRAMENAGPYMWILDMYMQLLPAVAFATHIWFPSSFIFFSWNCRIDFVAWKPRSNTLTYLRIIHKSGVFAPNYPGSNTTNKGNFIMGDASTEVERISPPPDSAELLGKKNISRLNTWFWSIDSISNIFGRSVCFICFVR